MTHLDPDNVRFLAQERLLDALIRSLALDQPKLIATLRSILVDTEFTHPGKPDVDHGLHQQIRERIEAASGFAEKHGSGQTSTSQYSENETPTDV